MAGLFLGGGKQLGKSWWTIAAEHILQKYFPNGLKIFVSYRTRYVFHRTLFIIRRPLRMWDII